jgi:hypothetical protein
MDRIALRFVMLEVRCGDRIAAATCETDSSPQMKAPQNEARRHKILLLAIVPSALKEACVELDFRPQLPERSGNVLFQA